MSVANSPKSTTKHHRVTQKSRNLLVILRLGVRDFHTPHAAVNHVILRKPGKAIAVDGAPGVAAWVDWLLSAALQHWILRFGSLF
jgi:hypothetical protein